MRSRKVIKGLDLGMEEERGVGRETIYFIEREGEKQGRS